jgi:RNA polymerase sigma factor (sigma-70 family)
VPETTSHTPAIDAPAGAWFLTTHWSVVLAAGDRPSCQQAQALERLCRAYWRPLYVFVRRQGHDVAEAQDLTQAFFARLLERNDLQTVRQEKGRFRSWLLVSLKNFLANEWHRAHAQKRGGRHRFISLDELQDEERRVVDPVEPVTAERLYERRWALTLLGQVLDRLEKEHTGNPEVLARWKRTLSGEAPTQAALAAELGMAENALKQAFHRLRQSYQRLLREEIAHTVAMPGDIEEELRHLINVLRT